MNRFLGILFVLTTAATAVGAPIDSAVYVRRQQKEEGRFNAGSGTVIAVVGQQSIILTAAHVVPDGGEGLTINHNGKEYKAHYLVGSKVTETPTALEIDGPDLCLLVVDAVLPVAEFSDRQLKKGDVVWQYGFQGGSAEHGPLPKLGKVTDPESIWSLADSRPGDSGCGLFYEDKIVGMVHMRSRDVTEPGGLSIPTKTIKEWLKVKAKDHPKLLAKFK